MLRALKRKFYGGGGQFLNQHNPALCIEVFEEKYAEVSSILHSYGYKMIEQVGYADYVFLKQK